MPPWEPHPEFNDSALLDDSDFHWQVRLQDCQGNRQAYETHPQHNILQQIRVATRAEPTITIQQLAHQFQLGHATIHKALRTLLKLKKRPCVLRPHHLTAAN